MPETGRYCGRFAPTPSGPMHLGSLVSALASYLHARHAQGEWRVRVEDLDCERVQRGAESAILRTLEQHGMHWDGAVVRQSEREPVYREYLQELPGLYWCTCTRKQRAGMKIYPGTCRHRSAKPAKTAALRLNTQTASKVDFAHGDARVVEEVATVHGDFVVQRSDGQLSWLLATAVDDGATGITHAVRGEDLYDTTAPQVLLQRLLGLKTPAYRHHALALLPDGRKLSKQNHAEPVQGHLAVDNLRRALEVLGISPPADLTQTDELLRWAVGAISPPQTR